MRTDAARDQKGLREQQTRFDAEAESFHRRVQEGFRLLARTHPERIKVVDASLPLEQIHQEIIRLVDSLLKSS
jgi:dTMP kinase